MASSQRGLISSKMYSIEVLGLADIVSSEGSFAEPGRETSQLELEHGSQQGVAGD